MSPHDAQWEAWARGEARCPHCIDLEEEDFESICDCEQFAREFPEAAARPWPTSVDTGPVFE